MRLSLAVICLFTQVVTAGRAIAEAAKENEAKSKPSKAPLATLPSPPGATRIKELGDGEWLVLGAPAPTPEWGPAPGRAYTNKMAYAPDLVGGFLQGEGVHGGRKSNSR